MGKKHELFYYNEESVNQADDGLRELMKTALKCEHEKGIDSLSPHSFWCDEEGKLYIRWRSSEQNEVLGTDDTRNMLVKRYWFNEADELCSEAIPRNLSKDEMLYGNGNEHAVLITGDTHGRFNRIEQFCRRFHTKKEDIMIILGDAGINYQGGSIDVLAKQYLESLPITLFCIHGNHERRPETIESYKQREWHGGIAYVEDRYPDIIFGKDGEVYDLNGHKTLVVGGAYSVDKWYRLAKGYHWFPDEQPSDIIKKRVMRKLEELDWDIDVVLTHTVPYKYMPTDLFIDTIDQSTVDKSTELWLGEIEEKLSYNRWYAGHYHCDRRTDKLQIMYKNVDVFCMDYDLGFSML